MNTRIIALLAALAIPASLVGCSVSTEPLPPRIGGYDTSFVYDVPPNIYSYPSYSYEGGSAYWANDRWYYQTPRGWVTFRREPPALVRQRTYIQSAPPAPNYRQGPGYVAPPARPYGGPGYTRPAPIQRGPARPGVAPPAVRVQ